MEELNMRPQELLGVFVRAAGLYFMLTAMVGLVAALSNFGNTPTITIVVPVASLIIGLLIVWSADAIVGFTYR
jgi:hypothetical protein